MAKLPLPSPPFVRVRHDGSFDYGPGTRVPALAINEAGGPAYPQMISPWTGQLIPMINIVSSAAPNNADGAPDGTIYLQTA